MRRQMVELVPTAGRMNLSICTFPYSMINFRLAQGEIEWKRD